MIIDDIVERTLERVAENKKRNSIEKLAKLAFDKPINKDYPFERALRRAGISYIMEIKRASPSKGVIAPNFDYKSIAKEYEDIGAAAISVVTEPDFFKGDDDFLAEIAKIVKIPVLRKDFVVDEYMIYEAKLLGADAVLLICSILDEITLMRCLNLAERLGMSALVEAHSSMQVKKALRVGAKIIGVNNRDLRNFEVDLNNSIELRSMVPENIIFVSESGIKTYDDIKTLEENNVDAVLVGETLMRSHDKRKTFEILQGLRNRIMQIKICGLFQVEDIDYVNEAKPDYVGFVFAKSKRQVDIHQAEKLKNKLDTNIKAVGVFVDEQISEITAIVKMGIIDLIQLHGHEDNAYIKQLKQSVQMPIIKAIKVIEKDDLNNLDYECDYYLLDSKISGSGKSFDWSLIKDLDKPFFLAGGIDLDNLDEAMSKADYGIDVSSGVETNGIKDRNKIIEIVRRTKNGNR